MNNRCWLPSKRGFWQPINCFFPVRRKDYPELSKGGKNTEWWKKKTGEQGYNEIRTKAIKEIPRDIFKEDSMERRKIWWEEQEIPCIIFWILYYVHNQWLNNTVLFLIIMYIFVQVTRHCEPTKEWYMYTLFPLFLIPFFHKSSCKWILLCGPFKWDNVCKVFWECLSSECSTIIINF